MLGSTGKDCATLWVPAGYGGGNVGTHVARVVDLEARKLATLSHPQTHPHRLKRQLNATTKGRPRGVGPAKSRRAANPTEDGIRNTPCRSRSAAA